MKSTQDYRWRALVDHEKIILIIISMFGEISHQQCHVPWKTKNRVTGWLIKYSRVIFDLHIYLGSEYHLLIYGLETNTVDLAYLAVVSNHFIRGGEGPAWAEGKLLSGLQWWSDNCHFIYCPSEACPVHSVLLLRWLLHCRASLLCHVETCVWLELFTIIMN